MKKPSKPGRPLLADVEASFSRPRLFERQRRLIIGVSAVAFALSALLCAAVLYVAYRILIVL